MTASHNSIEDLEAALVRDLAWRKKEIVSLRSNANMSDEKRGYFFRAGLVLLCAHWEGFLKRSVNLYVDHVFGQNLRVRELLPNFVAIGFFSDVRSAAASAFPASELTHLKLAERIAKGNEEACVEATWTATTEGNPGSEVLSRLLRSAGLQEQLGLDEATWSTTKVYIDEQIVRDRHLIAHGEGLPISRGEFLSRANRMVSLLDTVNGVILNAAQSATYRVSAIA